MKKLILMALLAFTFSAFADDVEPLDEPQAQTDAVELSTDCTWGDIPLDVCVHDVIDAACPALIEGALSAGEAREKAEQAQEAANRLLAYITGTTNVWFEVTNYYGSVSAPSLQLYEIRDGEKRCVWDERDWTRQEINEKLVDVNASIADARDNNPARKWSKYQSGTGAENPLTDTTWVSTPKVSLAGGYEWEKVATSVGQAWVMVNNGMAVNYGETAEAVAGNAYFKIEDLEGNAILTIKKTDSYLAGAVAGGVTTDGSTLIVRYATIADSHPVAKVTTSLDGEIVWYAEDDDACPASVVWSGTSGDYTARITPKVVTSSVFVFAEYEVKGTTLIEHTAPMSAEGGILCTDGIHKCRPKYVNGSIQWEVMP